MPGTDLVVSTIGLGCAKLGGVFQREGRNQGYDAIRAARDLGISFFDTADIYTQGESERILGKALARERGEVVIASKVGYLLGRQAPFVDRAKPLLKPIVRRLGLIRTNVPARIRGGPAGQDFSSRHVVEGVEASLRRLRSEYLDVLFLHSPSETALAEASFLEGVERLLRDGKIRWFGVSCERPEDAPVALGLPHVSCIQVPLNILEQDAIEQSILPAGLAAKGVVGRQCLASGLLSGGSLPDYLTALLPERRAALAAAVTRAGTAAASIGRDVPSAAVGFSLATPGISTTLIGAHTVAQVHQAEAWLRGLSSPEWCKFRALFGAV